MFKLDERTRRYFIVAITFLGQLSYAHRTFSIDLFAPLLFVLMTAAFLWANHKTRLPQPINEPFATKFIWLPIVIVVFAVSKSILPFSSGNQLVDMAHSIVLAELVGQIAIVATRGIARPELLVMASITWVLSLVCFEESIVLDRQITEAGIAICLFAMLSNVAMQSQPNSIRAGSRPRTLIYVIALFVVVLLSRPVAIAMDSWMPTLQLRLSSAIEENAIDTSNSSSIVSRYVGTGSLNEITEQLDRDPKAIALRVYADQEPGYLRGSVFERYHNGRWQQHREEQRRPAGDEVRDTLLTRVLSPESTIESLRLPGAVARRNTFSAPRVRPFLVDRRPSGKTVTLEIENDPRRGTFFFLPLHTSRIDGIGQRVVIGPNEIVQSGLDTRHTYFATVYQIASAPPISAPLRELTLRLPTGIASTIAELSKKVCGDASTPRSKAKRISDYFQRNFRYSLERREVAGNRDPIVNFLKSRHAAHCEYFASATTLMLRSCGVPARYVTGYVIREQADEGEAWLGRNSDAHAWVEAYDEPSKRWFTVESTPGREATDLEFASVQTATNENVAASDTAIENRWFEHEWQLWTLLRSGQLSQFFVEFSELLRWPLTVITVGLIIAMFRRRRSIRHTVDVYGDEYLKRLHLADRKMQRLGLRRSKSETIHRFASRIENLPGAKEGNFDRANWYRKFAELRYQSLPPTDLDTFPNPSN